MRKTLVFFWLSLLCASLAAEVFPVPALPFEPLKYCCYQAQGEVMVDGSLSDPDWSGAAFTESFTDIEGSLKPAPWLDTRVKMLWNDNGLYIGARLEEPHLWATLLDHDSVIFLDNDFEVFIDPNGDTHEYFELEVNALGTLWDLFIIKPYRDAHTSLNGWEAQGIELAIGLEGTLNDPSDMDRGWTVEMFLPWQAMEEMAHMPCPPRNGDFWRINFSRVQWNTDILEGQYLKRPGEAEHNWVWSPQGLVAMHYPERWGYVFFLDSPEEAGPGDCSIPETESAREYLRQLYYAQKQHWMDHGSYASSASALGLKPFPWHGASLEPVIETTSLSYVARLSGEELPVLHIREDGRLWGWGFE
jgi:hypothetical protein